EGRSACILGGGGEPGPRREEERELKVRKATGADVPTLVAMFQELDRMQLEWRVFTPRPGFYDEVAVKYREALDSPDRLLIVAEEEGEVVGMAYGEVRIPSRFSDERSLEVSGVM